MTKVMIRATKCRLVGCGFEAAGDGRFAERALDNHLATKHGIGEIKKSSVFGCPFVGCIFETAGSRDFTTEAMRRHLVEQHGVNPDNPETLPASRRSR